MRGRPTKYKEEFLEKVVDLMHEGASIEEVCYELKISRQTFYTWCDKYPDFLDTKKKGVEFSEGWWMKQGRTQLENKDFSYTGWYMNMKNRFKWTDRQETTHEGGDKPITTIVNLGKGIDPNEATD